MFPSLPPASASRRELVCFLDKGHKYEYFRLFAGLKPVKTSIVCFKETELFFDEI